MDQANYHLSRARELRAQHLELEALSYYRNYLSLNPDHAEVCHEFGQVLAHLKYTDLALQLYGRAIQLDPHNSCFYYSLGLLFLNHGQLERAQQSFLQAIKLKNDFADALYLLAESYYRQQHASLANQYYRLAIQADPLYAFAQMERMDLFQYYKSHENSLSHYIEALELLTELRPAAGVEHDIGIFYQKLGLSDLGIEHLLKATQLEPLNQTFLRNYVSNLRFQPHYNHSQIFKAVQKWGRVVGVESKANYKNEKKPERRLKIAYISPDFRKHSAASTFLNLFKHHQRQRIEVYAYADLIKPDSLTQSFQLHCDHWRDITALSTSELFDLIQHDQIDILVDLAGHTSHNRLETLVLKPAPIQMTGLGYGFTTGLKSVDYRFSDPYVTPPELVRYNSEKIVYLNSLMNWQPYPKPLDCGEPPVLKNGFITFGCSNTLFKINHRLIRVWSKLLTQLPTAKLFLKAPEFDQEKNRYYFRERFQTFGIASERLLFKGYSSLEEHLLFNQSIDIALDPFPYNGGITSCEILWMGVPLLTLLEGNQVGYSILANLGLTEFIAKSESDYIQRAIELAGNTPQLKTYRQTLRPLIEDSILCNGQFFTRDVERLFRTVWRNYCQVNAFN